MGEILCVLIANVLGFGTAYFVESKVQHLYKSSIKWIRYLNYFAFLFIGIGLVKIFNEFLRVVVLQQSVRIGEIVNGIAIFILIWPVTLFLISFAVSKLKNSQSVQVDINADVVEVVDVTNSLQANPLVTSNTKDFAVKTLIVTLSVVVILSLVAYLFNVTKTNTNFSTIESSTNTSTAFNFVSDKAEINLSNCRYEDGDVPISTIDKLTFSDKKITSFRMRLFDKDKNEFSYPLFARDIPCFQQSTTSFICTPENDAKYKRTFEFNLITNIFRDTYISFATNDVPIQTTLIENCSMQIIKK